MTPIRERMKYCPNCGADMRGIKMKELIYKQDAIAVADFSDYAGLSIEDVKKVTDEVIKGLKNLPPAQPEVTRCKDCKHRPKLDEEEGELDFPPTYRCPCYCDDCYYSWMPKDDWFCGNGERKIDETD